eukprot:GHVU01190298.1.p1 GENE.GHVU01190298.1~~GHVU01190298.1.p1  ORF type:complete len:108 (+),score=0.92 GHVU01190298.1:75-398(+)
MDGFVPYYTSLSVCARVRERYKLMVRRCTHSLLMNVINGISHHAPAPIGLTAAVLPLHGPFSTEAWHHSAFFSEPHMNRDRACSPLIATVTFVASYLLQVPVIQSYF